MLFNLVIAKLTGMLACNVLNSHRPMHGVKLQDGVTY